MMKTKLLLLLLLLFAVSTRGQELPTKPEPRPTVLYGNEEIEVGKVWTSNGRYFTAKKIGSCAWCSKPQRMRTAAFDKRSTAMWLGAIALSVASTEVTFSRPCFRAGTCREGNPLLGNSRAQHYGVKLPVIALAWWGTAYLRAGDKFHNIGGMRDWWLLPLAYQAGGVVSIAHDLAKKQPRKVKRDD